MRFLQRLVQLFQPVDDLVKSVQRALQFLILVAQLALGQRFANQLLGGQRIAFRRQGAGDPVFAFYLVTR